MGKRWGGGAGAFRPTSLLHPGGLCVGFAVRYSGYAVVTLVGYGREAGAGDVRSLSAGMGAVARRGLSCWWGSVSLCAAGWKAGGLPVSREEGGGIPQ